MRTFLLIVLLALSAHAFGDEWRVDPLTPLDRGFMEGAQSELNSLAQSKLGRSFGHSRQQDLDLIQTLLDRKLVSADETRLLQGMGIVMGEHLRRENSLNWVIYNDKLGRSRALEIPLKDEVIFPVTQISSRASVGADIDAQAIYRKLEDEITRIRKKIIVR